jgi:hypothetical protein
MVQISEYPTRRVLSFRTYADVDEPENIPVSKKKINEKF